jgi:hypothetical protein
VYNLLGKHILLYDADDFTLHYQLGHVKPDTLVPLPTLAGYPLVPDVEKAMEEVRQHLRAHTVTPEEVARQCAAAEFQGFISLQLLRKFLIDWGYVANENVCFFSSCCWCHRSLSLHCPSFSLSLSPLSLLAPDPQTFLGIVARFDPEVTGLGSTSEFIAEMSK